MPLNNISLPKYFHTFKSDITDIELPLQFTFPFYYTPHALSYKAAEEIQDYLQNQKDFEHNFGIDLNKEGLIIGKMFGALVVKTKDDKVGYLMAVSGKLAKTNIHKHFVPPVFDMLTVESFFIKEETVLNTLNAKLVDLESDSEYLRIKAQHEQLIQVSAQKIQNGKNDLKTGKKDRKLKRTLAKAKMNSEEYAELEKQLIFESQITKIRLKNLTESLKEEIKTSENILKVYEDNIDEVKTLRKDKSHKLQKRLFEQYDFLNIDKTSKNLNEIFENTTDKIPPAGAGECAAPKLLQYAFKNNLTPLSLIEFWWGQSPNTEIRQHGQYYPSCLGKCRPILGHMLKGMDIEPNPLEQNMGADKALDILFEDEYIIVINKPSGLLSVPGKTIKDSVLTRIKSKYPDILILHRLDMCTSGIIILAKTAEANKYLQRQFIKRTIKKTYIALLDGIIPNKSGVINLPLRLDVDDRPRQQVCYNDGKECITGYNVISQENDQTRVLFYPQTGRTHQLRVHAAHKLGLNTPIIGDDLYGAKTNRLHLHAMSITFMHPLRKSMTINVDPDF